jgi:hypothetical protein
MGRQWQRRLLAGLATAVTLAACSGPDRAPASGGAQGLPPVPSFPGQTGGPDQPPVIWIGGSVVKVTAGQIEVRGDSGSVVALQRLGREATGLFRASEGTWERLPPGAAVAAGEKACVETLMDGSTLLALRVFLGAQCGPV